jgi:cell division protein FtsL
MEGRRMRPFAVFDRRIRGFRIVELGAAGFLLILVLVVYLAKTGAGDKREDIERAQQQIDDEQSQIRLLRAEVATLEQPERLETLSAQYLNLQPIPAQHEVTPGALADLAHPSNGPSAPAAGQAAPGAGAAGAQTAPAIAASAPAERKFVLAAATTTALAVEPARPGGDPSAAHAASAAIPASVPATKRARATPPLSIDSMIEAADSPGAGAHAEAQR